MSRGHWEVGFELNNTNSMNTCDDGIEEAFINVGKILSGKLDETRNPVLWDIAAMEALLSLVHFLQNTKHLPGSFKVHLEIDEDNSEAVICQQIHEIKGPR